MSELTREQRELAIHCAEAHAAFAPDHELAPLRELLEALRDPAPPDEQPTTEERLRVELTRSEAESLFGGLRYMTCAPSAVERQAIRKSARGKLTAALTPASTDTSAPTDRHAEGSQLGAQPAAGSIVDKQATTKPQDHPTANAEVTGSGEGRDTAAVAESDLSTEQGDRWWVYRGDVSTHGTALSGYIGPAPDPDNPHDWIEVKPASDPTGDEERCPREAKDCSCQDGAPNPVGTRADLRADTEAAYLPRLERQSETAPVPAPPDPNQQVERCGFAHRPNPEGGYILTFPNGYERGANAAERRLIECVAALHHSEQLRAEAEAERDQAIKLQRQLYEDTAQARSELAQREAEIEKLQGEREQFRVERDNLRELWDQAQRHIAELDRARG